MNFLCSFNSMSSVADPEISKRGGTDRMLYTPLTALARTKLHAQCDSAGRKKGGHVPLMPYAGSATGVSYNILCIAYYEIIREDDSFVIAGTPEAKIGGGVV